MKRSILYIAIVIAAASLILNKESLSARGGGRGGGGGGRGGGHGRSGISTNPSPSMSRSVANRPATRPSPGRPVQGRPGAGGPGVGGPGVGGPGVGRPGTGRPGTGRPGAGPGVGRPGASRPEAGPGQQRPVPSRAVPNQAQYGQSAQARARAAAPALQNYPAVFNPRASNFSHATAQASRQVQAQIRSNYPASRSWFNNQFFDRHNYSPRFPGNDNWWSYPAWGAVASWYPSWGWSEPIYYDYSGYAQTMPTYSNELVQGGYQAETAVPSSADESGWLSLGVFAAGEDAATASFSNMIFQLAVDREGVVSGTYYNASTDKIYPLEGGVNQQTQRIYWRQLSDEPSTLMVSGMYNLTQDVVPVQAYFVDGTKQTWVLVRINQ